MSTGSIYRRGNVWWISYYWRGERYRESSGSRRKQDARELHRRRLGEMGQGRLLGREAEQVTAEDLFCMIETDYQVNGRRSLRRLRTSLTHLRRYFGRHRAADVRTDAVGRYIRDRQVEGAANATVRQELAALKRAFNLAVQSGWLPGAPHIPSLQVDNVREGFLTARDVEAVVAEIREPLRPVVRFAYLTGWRKGEILSLTWGQVDFEAGVARLEPGRTKNREGRTFPFKALPDLQVLLEQQRERTRAIEKRRGQIIPHVFHRDGDPIRTMDAAWRAACKRAGIEGAWFHDLRRSAVQNLERAGVPRSVAMKITGHKTEAVYRRYAIAESRALEEGVEKLARLHARRPRAGSGIPLPRQVNDG